VANQNNLMNDDTTARLGAVQLTSELGNKAANLDKAEHLLSELAGRAQIACLPEMFNTGYNLDALGDALFDLAEPIPGETTQRLSAMARQMQMGILAGMVEHDPHTIGLIYDSTVLFDAHGDLVGHYRKSHLYPAEFRFFRAGHELPVFDVDGLRVGIAICFEHAFPHIFTTLALKGAQVVFNPSAVPVGFDYLQDVRTRARAQDNQIYVVAVNHVGQEGDVTYCGQSQVANPRGEVVTLASQDTEAAVLVEISLDLIFDQRRQEPIFRGFRPELYEPLAR
jgi:predicted amidohydrolase